jgi:hypothetical protein
MDIEMKEIVGYKPPSLPLFNARRLKLQDPRITQRYLKLLKEHINAEDLHNKLHKLENIATDQWIFENIKHYENCAIRFRSAMLEAEKKCRKFHTGKHPWSPTLDFTRKTKFYWELTVKKLLGLKVPTRKIIKLQKQLQINRDTNISLELAQSNQKMAQKEYNKVKKRSYKYRATFRESLARTISTQKKISYASAIRDLINREETREMHNRIKWMRHKQKSLSTSGVLITDSKGNKKLISDKDRLEKVIISENEKKFHQTEGFCTLMEGTLFDDIGLFATGPKVPDILSGKYKPPTGTTRAAKSILKACKKPEYFSPATYNHLSKEHYIRAWSQAKEKTGSGKVHFGHWKAGILEDEIAHSEWLLTTLPAKHGFSPKIWQHATDVMILKKEGVLDLEKLRTLVLYEADFNFFNKCIGRQMMDNAMDNDCMASEQYAKPKSSAQEQCLTRRLVFDLVRYTRSALAMASSDLKSCYDRIVHNAASLAMQKCGISQEIVTTMFETIQQCQHSIRTAYGDSSITYSGKGQYNSPPMGAGQGNGAGPQMWAILSSTLFLAMHMEGLSTEFCQKMTKKMILLTGFMYVDDMDLIRISDDMDSTLLTEDLQLTLSYWNQLVKVTGGALEPNKSGWYAFHQMWDNVAGEYRYEDIGTTGDITACDKDGKRVSLPFISCHTAQEMIGVKMTPTGDHTEQIKSMQAKALEEARFLRLGSISETDTRHALITSIYPCLAWPLLCMSLSHTESKLLLRPLLKAALPKMGIVSTLGYDYIHGSADFQGLGIPELFHNTYAIQLETIVDHLWKHTQTGHFISMAIQEFILEAGSTQHPLSPQENSRVSKWLLTNNTWFAALHQYITDHNIKVRLNIPLLSPLRENDTAIMDLLDDSHQFSMSQLKDINTCRIYKKVIFLSEIATGDGKSIAKWAFTDVPNVRNIKYPFNPQGYPTHKQWTSWKAALQYINQSETNRLRIPLGKWTLDEEEFLEFWDYFYDHGNDRLLHRSPQSVWTSHPSVPGVTRQLSFSVKGTEILPPTTVSPVLSRTTVKPTSSRILSEGNATRQIIAFPNDFDQQCRLDDSLIRSLGSKFTDSSWALQHIEMSDSINQLLTDFSSNVALMVGDGSYDDLRGVGASACIVSSSNGEEFIIVGGPTPGPPSQQNAYRSELGSLVSMGILSHILSEFTKSSPTISVSCDNDNALERPFLPRHLISAKQRSADLISLAHDIWHASPTTPLPTQVLGHADDLNRELSMIEQLNCIVDSKAKEYGSDQFRIGDPEWGMAHISIHGRDITGRISQAIQSTFALRRSKSAAIRNKRVSHDTWSKLDHRALSRSSSQMSTRMKIFITKWTSGQLPVGSILKQRNHRLFDTCPCCHNEPEDMNHLYICKSPDAIQAYNKNLEALSEWMT